MNEPYHQTAPRPMNTGSSVTMKAFTCSLGIFIIAQLVGTMLFGIYLHMKLDKVEEDMSLNEDYLFIRRLKKCMKGDDERTLLNCKETLSRVHKLILEVTKQETTANTYSMLKEDKKQPIAAHLHGLNSSRSTSVLEWTKTGYSTINVLTHDKDKLKVERPGLYYIYSQVTFCVNTTSRSLIPFVQYIYLSRPHETDKLLLKGASTHNASATSTCSQQSIHQGGLFDLQKGDALFVSVTDSSKVRYMPGYTYFGMFMI